MTVRRACVGAMVAVVFAGTGGADAAPAPDPCSLLTETQVGAVLGVPVDAGKHLATAVCLWVQSNPPPGSAAKRVTVTLLTERGFAAAKTPVGGTITKVPVTGIGDEAVFGTTGKVAASLAVRKGAAAFSVFVQGFSLAQPQGVADVQAKEKSLAMQVLSKL